MKVKKIFKTEEEWRRTLTPEQFKIMREKGTEPAFSCAWPTLGKGVYVCTACELPLFHSGSKFDSGTGWPSYFEPIDPDHIEEHLDDSMTMERTEVVCARCDSHLGHVFDDGPPPTGKRFCINSLALKFQPKK